MTAHRWRDIGPISNYRFSPMSERRAVSLLHQLSLLLFIGGWRRNSTTISWRCQQDDDVCGQRSRTVYRPVGGARRVTSFAPYCPPTCFIGTLRFSNSSPRRRRLVPANERRN